MAQLAHNSLNARLTGVKEQDFVHYRGIPYGTINARFEDPVIKEGYDGTDVDCTRFGPRCPQIKLDVGYLLREPEGDVFHDETEDEFKCLNLDVAVPASAQEDSQLPVFFWIHGGSQVVSYGNSASKVGDVRKLVGDSVQHGMPMIVVSVQYRLNIFAMGDSPDSKNYALKDLQCAIEWVRRHIAGFGGDASNITLVGESAGAALVHALVIAGADVKRASLMSGSLYMSSPRTHEMAKAAVIYPIAKRLLGRGHNIRGAPVEELIDAQTHIPIVSVFLQEDPCLTEWMTSTGKIEELMVGDCEFESAIFRNGVETLSAAEIDQAFSKADDLSAELKKLYHINASRPSSCRAGALDFLNDNMWTLPVAKLRSQFEAESKTVWAYSFDQPNPWQASARAHHAVDLLHLFEGFDLSSNPGAMSLAAEMRRRFILFANGRPPWAKDKICGFGPHGKVAEIENGELHTRRRVGHMSFLQSMPPDKVAAVRAGLVVGTLSLLN